ncbi:hypothetical protein DEU56DRAFT_761564 [Suillus clintonianus]|uniref:uncharacterized protein n=1 Tax=Suillus clintonianus TaxID=1904413 RepID=UPI001B87966D|nr:uncharacterized protein DEU56DRAFT_761564 [Suillus clintonianus]KAG2116293.1 hypothetical protein DEU56DRAFT_761564 [Suillus clintonianus]
MESKILDWDPRRSRIVGALGYTPENTLEDGWNTDDDLGGLSAAIDNCKIVHSSGTHVQTTKGRRGRPKKRVVQRRTKQMPGVASTQDGSSAIQNALGKCTIRATTSPVPDHFPARADVVYCVPTDETISTTCDGLQEHEVHEDQEEEEEDVVNIVQEILNSGIMDWNPQESWTAKQNTDHRQHIDPQCEEQSTAIESCRIAERENDTQQNKPRRARGRPNKTGIPCRSTHKALTFTDNSSVRHVIRATSNPCQQEAPNNLDGIYDGVGINTVPPVDACEADSQPTAAEFQSLNINGTAMKSRKVGEQPSTRRGRGRPKKYATHKEVNASRTHVTHEASSNIVELQTEDDDHNQRAQWRSQSIGGAVDHDYRPTPPPEDDFRAHSLEAPAPTLAALTEQEIASRSMAQPGVWLSVLHSWTTLGLNEWLEAAVANFYLSHVWYEMLGRTHMRYVDWNAATANNIEDEELEHFRRNHFVPHDGTCAMAPVGFIVHHSNHFFVVIFDYERRMAHVLGRHISADSMDVDGEDPHDWNDWRGPEYWRKIGALHGWSTGDVSDVSINPMDWEQNGVDCGPIACSMSRETLPDFEIQCGHKLRIHMLRVIAAHTAHEMIGKTTSYPTRTSSIRSRMGDTRPDCLKLLRRLIVVSATCSLCQRPIVHQDGEHASHSGENGDGTNADPDGPDGLSEDDDTTNVVHAMGKAHLDKLFKASKHLAGSRNRNSIVPRAIGTHLQLEPELPSVVHDTEDSQRTVAATTSRRRVKSWYLGSNRRFPRPTAPIPLAAYGGRRWLPDDHGFDEYEGGPTIEMMMTPRDIDTTMTFRAGGMQISTAWLDWVDCGYRITPSSFHIFYQCDPTATMDHIMPIGTTDSHDPSDQVPDRVTGAYSLKRRGTDHEEQRTYVNDVEILSASELVESAQYDPPLQDECRFGHNAFVRGCTSHRYGDGPALYVDLERDAVSLSEDEIEISVDIDSIIWTTKVFRCKGSVGVYIVPPFQTKPGIYKHNHTYVEITIPQSEEDANSPGGRTEWLSKRFPMSAIPHVCMGRISSASSTLNLYIAFPRMIHQHPTNGRRITLMPKEVLDIFWDRVLLPSIGQCTDVSWEPYLKHTLEEARYKARGADGRRGGWGPPKTIPLSDDDFCDVQKRMEARIRDGGPELSMYGSFFFILEGKGIKLLTKDGQRGRFSGPEEALRRNLPDLDWKYMMNRRHGELLVDVGVSFTPHSPSVPLVGVWRLDALEASFGAGGYKRGEIHHHNTLSRYGALQAEMQQERSQQTHIAFRSTYNLYYESIRTNSNQANFASDSDAYKLSPSYMAECTEIAKVVEGCKEKTYGVRDEYRVSGHAARIILENVEEKAREYLKSDPVLWIPSKIWFELLRRRVREIQRTQISIVRKNPPNLGVLTGVLNHMLRSTTSTPIIYDSHVRESLALLEYRNILETAGMFFLHDFDINSDTCLTEVQQIDDVHVLALMGVNAKAQRDRAVSRTNVWQSTESELEDYPLGPHTNMDSTQGSHVKLACNDHETLGVVTQIVQHSTLRRTFGGHGIRPHPNSLQEAMKCWTITSIDDTLAAVAFEACNAGLNDSTGVTPGRMGPKSRPFLDRCTLFFPDPDAAHKDNTQWSGLWEGDGYIAEFHRTMKAMDEDQQQLLKQGLRERSKSVDAKERSNRVHDQSHILQDRLYWKGEARVQKRAPKARRTMKLIKGKRIFAADLMDSQPFDTDGNLRRKTERQKRRELQKQMTMAKKNKRVPPPPRPRRPFPITQLEDIVE